MFPSLTHLVHFCLARLSLTRLSLTRLSFRAVLICAWAEKGADALGPDGVLVHSDAFPPEKLVDTLGAGDTFNAGVIFMLSNGNRFVENLKQLNVFGIIPATKKGGKMLNIVK